MEKDWNFVRLGPSQSREPKAYFGPKENINIGGN